MIFNSLVSNELNIIIGCIMRIRVLSLIIVDIVHSFIIS